MRVLSKHKTTKYRTYLPQSYDTVEKKPALLHLNVFRNTRRDKTSQLKGLSTLIEKLLNCLGSYIKFLIKFDKSLFSIWFVRNFLEVIKNIRSTKFCANQYRTNVSVWREEWIRNSKQTLLWNFLTTLCFGKNKW